MEDSTRKAWLDFSRRLKSKYTARELGEAILCLVYEKPGRPGTVRRIWIAVIIGAMVLVSIGVTREVTNSRALAAQVQEANEARAEAQEAAQRILKLQQDIVITMSTDLEAGRYQRALLFTKAAVQTDPDLRDELFLLCIDALFDGDAEQAQETFAKEKRE